MSVRQRTLQKRLLYGRDREQSARWLKIAGVFVLVPFIALYTPVLIGLITAELEVGIGNSIDGGALFLDVLFGLAALGVAVGMIHAYLNDGLLVSIAFALTPWVGWMLIVEGIIWWTRLTDPAAWATMEGGAYLYLIPGAFALFVGVVGFALGAVRVGSSSEFEIKPTHRQS